jgi:hypothetical protein
MKASPRLLLAVATTSAAFSPPVADHFKEIYFTIYESKYGTSDPENLSNLASYYITGITRKVPVLVPTVYKISSAVLRIQIQAFITLGSGMNFFLDFGS